MTDFLVNHLPTYVNQFKPSIWAPHPSGYRCVTASAAMAIDYAYPHKHDPEQVEHDMYVKYAGPDVQSDVMGLTKVQLKEILDTFHVGYLDMDPLVQQGLNGSPEALLSEIEAQNYQNVIQVITVQDESVLKHAKTGVTLHNWSDALNHGSHTFVRVGYSDDLGYGLYMEPAAPGFSQPVPIFWSDILAGKLITCVSIMPPGVNPPPASFSYQHGTWPAPVPPQPTLDIDKVYADLASMQTQLNAALALVKAVQTDEKGEKE